MTLTIRVRSLPPVGLRCALCHDALVPELASWRCRRCDCRAHPECTPPRCPTLGCAPPQLRVAAPRAEPGVWWMIWPSLLSTFVILSLLGGVVLFAESGSLLDPHFHSVF